MVLLEALYTSFQKSGTNVQLKNQMAYWQENKTFLYCFPKEKDERDFNFSGISDKTLGPIYIKESYPGMFSFGIYGIFAKT